MSNARRGSSTQRNIAAGRGKARYNAAMQATRSTTVALVAAFSTVVISMAALRAQQPPAPAAPAGGTAPAQGAPAQGAAGQGAPAGRGGAPPADAAPPARPIVPASASSIGAKPDAYYGQIVTIYATVEELLAPTAFSVDQEKGKASAGKEVLVLAPRLHEQVKPNTYVTVIGEVVHADPAEITKKAKPNTPGLPADVDRQALRPAGHSRQLGDRRFVQRSREVHSAADDPGGSRPRQDDEGRRRSQRRAAQGRGRHERRAREDATPRSS